MSTFKVLYDIDHVTADELKTIIRCKHALSGKDFEAYDKAIDHAFAPPEIHTYKSISFDIGEDDAGFYHPFRDEFDSLGIDQVFLSCETYRNSILIALFRKFNVSYDIYGTWEKDWNHPETKKDWIDLIRWLEKHDNHWIMQWN